MKKAIIATAVVLVLSFISTVCFGVALGSQGLRAFFRDGGAFDEWTDTIAHWNDVALYTEDLVDTDDRAQLFVSERTQFAAGDTLKITAYCGNVRVVRGTGDQVEVVLEQYSARINPTSKYTLSVMEDSEIRLSAASDLDGVAAALTVYVPQPLVSLTVEVDFGEVDIRGVTADTLYVNLAAGDLDLADCTLKNADLHVATGDAELQKTVAVSDSLVLTCDCGDVEMEIPENAPFTLQYAVQTGDAEIDASVPSELLRAVKRNAASCQGELQRTGADGETGGQYTVSVTLGNLEIGTGTDFDD